MRTLPHLQCGGHRRPRRFAGDRRGVAAVEFALILPIMLALYVGVTEVGQAISIARKVTITVRTITDLVTQYAAISDSEMTSLLNASAQVMAPYPSSNVIITVSEVSTDSSGNATVVWSASLNGTAYTAGQSVTLPSALDQPNIYLIWGQAHYKYTPIIGAGVIGTTNLKDQIYMNPRLCTAIDYKGPSGDTTTSTQTQDCASVSSGGGSSGGGSSGGGSSGGGSSGGGSSGGGGGGWWWWW